MDKQPSVKYVYETILFDVDIFYVRVRLRLSGRAPPTYMAESKSTEGIGGRLRIGRVAACRTIQRRPCCRCCR